MMNRQRMRSVFFKLLLVALLCQVASASIYAQWTKSVQIDQSDMALDLAEALTFTKYPTYSQYVAMMQHFADTYPEICRLDTFGTSGQGRLLLALKISNHAHLDEPEASFLYTATMHGDELVGFPLLLRLADYLLSGYGTDPEVTSLLDNLAIWINPLSNPDGTYYPDNDNSVVQSIRSNASGINLNRDFPDPASREPDDTTGRARETRAMMELLREERFTLSANIHAGEEVVNYPWDHTYALHADDDWFRFVSREYADEARAVDPAYMANFEYGITNGAAWYIIFGGRQDYVTWYLGGREVTLELSTGYRLESETLDEYWQKNERSLLNYMSQCLYGIRGTVTDRESGEAVRAQIFIENHDSAYSVVHSSATFGDYYRLVSEGVYDLVVSAPGYLNDTLHSVEVTDYQATWLDIELQKEPVTAVQRPGPLPGFRIYPNPVLDRFMIDPENIPYGKLELSIHAIDGRLIYHETLSYHGSAMELSTNLMEPGTYLVRCTSGHFSQVQRVIVVRSINQ
jgi:hypothetical protein